MKRELLDFLVCPICQQEFELRESLREAMEILEGSLICKRCGKEYFIVGGIPRLITGLEEKSTAERFGYEWKEFPKLSSAYEIQFLDWISPVDKNFFRDKVILDAGCGKGRHVYLASHFGARTVVGIDASKAIEVAYANTRDLPNVHLIQADIYHPPLRRAFDYIYSIGVLHHLSKPEGGFKALSGLLKAGGTMSVWVYGREGNEWIICFVNPFRRFLTSKMPLPVLKKISLLLALFVYALCKSLYKPVNLHFKSLRSFLFYNEYLFYISQFDFREIYSIVFDHLLAPVAYYLSKDEVLRWFEKYHFGRMIISWHNKNSWRVKGELWNECR